MRSLAPLLLLWAACSHDFSNTRRMDSAVEDDGALEEDDAAVEDADTPDAEEPTLDGGAADADPVAPGLDAAPDASSCPAQQSTILSGVVHAAEGTIPLAGVSVYVASQPVPAMSHGASCARCSAAMPAAGTQIATTDENGRFELLVDASPRAELIVEIGKWRRRASVDVVACQRNELSPERTRLPRNRTEGELPKVALVTGAGDTLECLLRKMGIADSEFTTAVGPGSVHVFAGADSAGQFAAALNQGTAYLPATSLWGALPMLRSYDLVILGCEGKEDAPQKPEGARKALHDYVAEGGRVLANHLQSYWLREGPPAFASSALFMEPSGAARGLTLNIDTATPRGQRLSDWLAARVPSAPPGKLALTEARHSVISVSAPSVRLLYTEEVSPTTIQAYSLDLPAGATCGRVSFFDFHVMSGDRVEPFPQGCSLTGWTPDALAALHLLLDSSACL